MKAERKSSRLRQILDETAEQMCFLSHLDEKSARLLTDEVISENDLIEKTHKLLHIMVDEISTMKMNNAQSQSSSTAFLYAMLSKSNRNVPIDGDELMKWIPAKIDEHRRQIHELKQVTKQQRNEIDTLKKECKQRSESTKLDDQKRLSTENPNGTEITRMKKKLERKTKKVALLKKELAAVKSGDKEDLTHMHSQIDRLKGVVQTLKNQLSDMNSGRSDTHETNEEVEKLQKENQELKDQLEAVSETRTSEELKALREKYSIVIAELRSVKDENARLAHQLKCHNDAAQERHDAMKHIEIEKDSLSSKLMDALNQAHELEEKLKTLTMEKERLSHQCIRLEATLSKERDALTSRVGNEGDLMNLQRFGFLLADALGEEFNPSAVETELNRLIAIAGRGHEEPLFVPSAGNKEREYHRIHTQFDELESQISALQSTMQTCT